MGEFFRSDHSLVSKKIRCFSAIHPARMGRERRGKCWTTALARNRTCRNKGLNGRLQNVPAGGDHGSHSQSSLPRSTGLLQFSADAHHSATMLGCERLTRRNWIVTQKSRPQQKSECPSKYLHDGINLGFHVPAVSEIHLEGVVGRELPGRGL
jgi:hypothetical protein